MKEMKTISPESIEEYLHMQLPSFWYGAASVIDIFGVLTNYPLHRSTDRKAIESDWTIVGNDLRSAIEEVSDELQ